MIKDNYAMKLIQLQKMVKQWKKRIPRKGDNNKKHL